MRGQRQLPKIGQGVWGAFLLAAGIGMASDYAMAKEYIVKFKSNEQYQDGARELDAGDFGTVFDQHPEGRLVGIRLENTDSTSEAQQLVKLMQRPDVEYVVENIKIYAFNTPNDPRYSEQWALKKVQAEAAWTHNIGSKDVVVAVIDTGIDYKHQDLKDNMWINPKEIAGNGIDDDGNGFIDDVYGWDFRQNDADPYDVTSDKNPGHGTHCAGIIGAVANNNLGISGMAQNVSLMAVRFLGEDGSGDLMSGAKAVDYAVNMGVDIISASWGAAAPASAFGPVLDAIGRANEKGIIFVAAAANDGKNNDTREVYPANANYPNVISVAASQSDDSKPSWSNFGKRKVHIASPGHEILSTIPENGYRLLSGTSMATPLVAGLVALMVSQSDKSKDLNAMAALSVLQATGSPVAIETACDCRVDAGAALQHVTDRKLTLVPNSITLAPNESKQFSAFGGEGPFQFAIDNANVATIDANGNLQAKAEGEATITLTDASGTKAMSKKIRVAPAEQGGGAGECPLQDPAMCQLMCLFDPTLPWCSVL